MAELTCPLCGMPVRVPHAEANTRYLCKKCHAPFYLNESKQAIVGEPPDMEEHFQAIKQQVREKVKTVPVKKIVTWLSVLLVVWVAWRVLFGPRESLESVGKAAAQALADNDPASLRWIAAGGTADDVGRWFEEVSPRLAQARQGWHRKDVVVDVHAHEDRDQRKGVVGVSIHPGVATGGLDVSLADPSAATASAPSPFEVEMDWTLNRWGRWKLDGHETYAKAHPSP
jgi:hypothetical protein